MDPNDTSGLSSYFQPQQPAPPPPPPPSSSLNPAAPIPSPTTGAATISSPTNGILPNNPTGTPTSTTTTSSPMVYPHSVPSAVSTGLETVKRKRGRPRKYGTPEQAAAAKRLSSSAPMSPPKKKDHAFNSRSAGGGAGASSSSKKFQLASVGNTGQSFIPHVITVAAGEDVGQKILMFTQQSKREICILSASGSISNASLRQPATSGGSITYEGRFDILSLSGSFVGNEVGGKTGGLSVCLASTDGQIIGGGVGGPLTAAGPIQVIVGTFLLDSKKDVAGAAKGDASAGKLPSPTGGASISGVSLWSPIDSYQNIGGSQFMIQPGGMHLGPAQSMEWKDQSGNDVQQSPENGNYEHIPE